MAIDELHAAAPKKVEDKEVSVVQVVVALLVGFATLWMGLDGLSQGHNRPFALLFLGASVFCFVSGFSGIYLKFDDVRRLRRERENKLIPNRNGNPV